MIITKAQIDDVYQRAKKDWFDEKERLHREAVEEDNRQCRELRELGESLFKPKD